MKKFLIGTAVALISLSLCACGGEKAAEGGAVGDTAEAVTEEMTEENVEIDNMSINTLVVNTCGKDINELYISTGQGWSDELLMGTSIQNGGTMPVTIDFNKNLDSYDLKAVCDGEEIEFSNMYINENAADGITINLTETEGGYLATVE